MKKIITSGLIAVSLSMTGCASIISGANQTLTFRSVPEEASISITNKAGEKIHTGTTPVTVTLKRGAGYFKAAAYEVRFEKEGYQAKTVHVRGTGNGWYIANVLLGGLVGLLIVDPVTGAMYSLTPSDVNAVLDASPDVVTKTGEPSLTVMPVQDIPAEMMQRAELITSL